MIVLFCHDGPLGTIDGSNFYGIAHNNSTFNRYFNIADELHIAIRVKTILEEEAKKRSQLTVEPLKVIACPNTHSLSGIMKMPKLKRIIKDAIENVDYVVARVPSTIGYIASEIALDLGKPLLVEAVACPWDAYWNYSFKGKILAPFTVFKMKKTLKNAPYALYVTNEFLQHRYPTEGKTVSCSDVSLSVIDDLIIEKRFSKINKPNERIKLGTAAATNVRFKGQQYVIRALGKLKKQGITNYEYQIVGGGDQSYLHSEAIKNNVEDQVIFLGAIPHEKVFEWLDSIDIYIQPSRQEGLPRALIEAMSRGLPCMGARTGGIPELLDTSFIFNNSRHEIDEIIHILQKMTPEIMKAQALRNFDCAKHYEKETLEKRRREFFEDFKNSFI